MTPQEVKNSGGWREIFMALFIGAVVSTFLGRIVYNQEIKKLEEHMKDELYLDRQAIDEGRDALELSAYSLGVLETCQQNVSAVDLCYNEMIRFKQEKQHVINNPPTDIEEIYTDGNTRKSTDTQRSKGSKEE